MTERVPRFPRPNLPPLPGRRPATDAATPNLIPTADENAESSIIDAALYRDGGRFESPPTITETIARLREVPGAMAWIGMFRPTERQLLPVAEAFGLHEVAVEDAIQAHQRPKLERYGETLFVVLRAATYLDRTEEVEFGEIHIFVGANFVLTVRHSSTPDLAAVRRRMEADAELLAMGPEAVLYAILDTVVDGYLPVVAGLQKDIDEIETQVFSGDPKVSRRIYELSTEVIEFQRSTQPLLNIIDALTAGFAKYRTNEELQRYLRDVADHATVVVEQVAAFHQNLSDILTVNATLVNQAQNEEIRELTVASYKQNEDVKRISAWAAIFFAPSLIGTVYGMNFENMPELSWEHGYVFALGLMVLSSLILWIVFRRRGWL